VDAELFVPMDRDTAQQASGITGTALGYVGRLVPEKGLSGLLDAVAKLDASVGLYFVGDGPMREELADKANALGIAERVHFVGPKPLDQLPSVMNAIDALVLPSLTTASWKEQFGRVIIEAFACGTPVVGSDSGAIPHVIADDGGGFAEDDTQAMARAINACLSQDESVKAQARLRRRERVEAEFTWGVVARRYAELWRGLIEGRTDKASPTETDGGRSVYAAD